MPCYIYDPNLGSYAWGKLKKGDELCPAWPLAEDQDGWVKSYGLCWLPWISHMILSEGLLEMLAHLPHSTANEEIDSIEIPSSRLPPTRSLECASGTIRGKYSRLPRGAQSGDPSPRQRFVATANHLVHSPRINFHELALHHRCQTDKLSAGRS